MKIGIDKIAFSTSKFYLDLVELAQKRAVDPNKFIIGIGQEKMAVIPPSQDIVTMAADACDKILTDQDKLEIDYVLFATESGIDNSKAAGIYLASLIGLRKDIKIIELKQACFGATAGINVARDYIYSNPKSKVLVIGADIARYGLNTKGEVTQGGGACVILLSANPNIMALEKHSSVFAENVMDFWRPLGESEARVDGKLSEQVYLKFLKKTFTEYQNLTGYSLSDFNALIFHLPYTKMGMKALNLILENSEDDTKNAKNLLEEFENSRKYAKIVGNLYTGSLYLSLISLLEHTQLPSSSRIGLFSYGSGAEGQFFSGILQKDYQNGLLNHNKYLSDRKQVSVEEYEKLFKSVVKTGKDIQLDNLGQHKYFLSGVINGMRKYEKRK